MGSDRHYPEEGPAHFVYVAPFRIDRTPVTNRQFREFVTATGYVTIAELVPDSSLYPDARLEIIKPGSMVFRPPSRAIDEEDWRQWWHFELGANWRRPYGKGKSNQRLDDHPVVQVAFQDVEAYAHWAGKELPTEAEWEFAAWGGMEGYEFPWGNELTPDGQFMANTWQGRFPSRNTLVDGYGRTSPVGSFPANHFGLYDMIGNVWEWTASQYTHKHVVVTEGSCCGSSSPRAVGNRRRLEERIPSKVVKGGSHLCAPNYCRRYRPPARHAQPVDTGMSHIGFRCVVRTSSDDG